MYEFKLQGMSCGACIKSISHALRTLDPGVQLTADLATQTVRVESGKNLKDLTSVIEEAGYTVVAASPSPAPAG